MVCRFMHIYLLCNSLPDKARGWFSFHWTAIACLIWFTFKEDSLDLTGHRVVTEAHSTWPLLFSLRLLNCCNPGHQLATFQPLANLYPQRTGICTIDSQRRHTKFGAFGLLSCPVREICSQYFGELIQVFRKLSDLLACSLMQNV